MITRKGKYFRSISFCSTRRNYHANIKNEFFKAPNFESNYDPVTVESLKDFKHFDELLTFVENEENEEKINFFQYSSAIRYLIETNQIARAFKLFSKQNPTTPKILNYNQFIIIYYSKKKFSQVIQLFGYMRFFNIHCYQTTYLVVLRSLFLSGRIQKGYDMIEYLDVNKIPIDAETYNEILCFLLKNNVYSNRVDQFYCLMMNRKIKFSLNSYNIILRKCINEKFRNIDFNGYLKIILSENFISNEETYQNILNQSCKLSNIPPLDLKTTNKEKLESICFPSIIYYLCENKFYLYIKYFLEYIENKNYSLKLQTCENLMFHFYKNDCKQFYYITFLFNWMVKNKINRSLYIYQLIIQVCCSFHFLDKAEFYIFHAKYDKLDHISLYEIIIDSFSKFNNKKKLLFYLNEMQKISGKPSIAFFENIFSNLFGFKSDDDIFMFYSKMIEYGHSISLNICILLLKYYSMRRNFEKIAFFINESKLNKILIPGNIINLLSNRGVPSNLCNLLWIEHLEIEMRK